MLRNLSWSFLAFSLLIFAGCEKTHGPYMRILNGHLEVASKSFKAKNNNGPTVTLLGVIHIGESEYYEDIQSRLDQADLVLFERVGKDKELTQIKNEVQQKCPQFKHRLQNVCYQDFASALGLSAQMAKINYNGTNLKHADMSLKKFNGEIPDCKSFEEDEWEKMRFPDQKKDIDEIIKNYGNNPIRGLMAIQLSKGISEKRGSCEPSTQKIIFDRNDIAVKKLEKHLQEYTPDQEIIIFYGAGHMEDIEEYLLGRQYESSKTEWLKAIKL